jgi:pyruvate/2-oxoglutarate dehydrogenase complex dihydrolipoamide dehydrogenase (E3) component
LVRKDSGYSQRVETTGRYDAIIIGSGQGGTPLARAFADAGWKAALVEREHVAGTCINVGCTPSKTMVASARIAYLARRARDYGVNTGPVTMDMAAVRRRKQAIVDDWRASGEHRLREAHVELVMGEAQFIGPRSLEVRLLAGGRRVLEAERVFINTGAVPAVPAMEGLSSVPYLNSTRIMELEQVPEHLLILGGGYVAVEFGQMFRRFGSEVTVVQRHDRLLTREDADVAGELAAILREDGVELLLDSQARGVRPTAGGRIALDVTTPAGERTVEGTHLLVATGRVPNTERLQLAAAGLAVDEHGAIPVNDRLETGAPGVWALGDVKGGPAFTHVSYDDFRIIRANVLQGGEAHVSGRLVPYTVFTDPQLGRIGLGEEEARAMGLDIRVFKLPMNWVSRALEVSEPRGLMKAVVDTKTDRILGCAILGIEGGELMAVIEVAMIGGVTASTLREAVFTHPTLAEAFNTLFAG